MTAALAFEDVTKVFANGTTVLSHVSLGVEAGKILAIVGGSGCGKSTLLRLASGLDQASAGRVRLDAATVTEPTEAIGLVFQEPRLLPWLTVGDNVGFGLEGLAAAERASRVAAALARVGLDDKATAWPRQLSGGQAQRAALARALVTRPKALLLDEPFSALDAITRADLQDHLLELWAEFRTTLVLVTHDVEEAVYLADEVAVMAAKPGRISARIPIDVPRPRRRRSPELDAAAREVAAALDAALERDAPLRSRR